MTSEAIVDFWMRRMGAGFHPENAGAEYDFLSVADQAQFDLDMAALHDMHPDPCELALAWLEAQG